MRDTAGIQMKQLSFPEQTVFGWHIKDGTSRTSYSPSSCLSQHGTQDGQVLLTWGHGHTEELKQGAAFSCDSFNCCFRNYFALFFLLNYAEMDGSEQPVVSEDSFLLLMGKGGSTVVKTLPCTIFLQLNMARGKRRAGSRKLLTCWMATLLK